MGLIKIETSGENKKYIEEFVQSQLKPAGVAKPYSGGQYVKYVGGNEILVKTYEGYNDAYIKQQIEAWLGARLAGASAKQLEKDPAALAEIYKSQGILSTDPTVSAIQLGLIKPKELPPGSVVGIDPKSGLPVSVAPQPKTLTERFIQDQKVPLPSPETQALITSTPSTYGEGTYGGPPLFTKEQRATVAYQYGEELVESIAGGKTQFHPAIDPYVVGIQKRLIGTGLYLTEKPSAVLTGPVSILEETAIGLRTIKEKGPEPIISGLKTTFTVPEETGKVIADVGLILLPLGKKGKPKVTVFTKEIGIAADVGLDLTIFKTKGAVKIGAQEYVFRAGGRIKSIGKEGISLAAVEITPLGGETATKYIVGGRTKEVFKAPKGKTITFGKATAVGEYGDITKVSSVIIGKETKGVQKAIALEEIGKAPELGVSVSIIKKRGIIDTDFMGVSAAPVLGLKPSVGLEGPVAALTTKAIGKAVKTRETPGITLSPRGLPVSSLGIGKIETKTFFDQKAISKVKQAQGRLFRLKGFGRGLFVTKAKIKPAAKTNIFEAVTFKQVQKQQISQKQILKTAFFQKFKAPTYYGRGGISKSVGPKGISLIVPLPAPKIGLALKKKKKKKVLGRGPSLQYRPSLLGSISGRTISRPPRLAVGIRYPVKKRRR